jgi:hypothetical protein
MIDQPRHAQRPILHFSQAHPLLSPSEACRMYAA